MCIKEYLGKHTIATTSASLCMWAACKRGMMYVGMSSSELHVSMTTASNYSYTAAQMITLSSVCIVNDDFFSIIYSELPTLVYCLDILWQEPSDYRFYEVAPHSTNNYNIQFNITFKLRFNDIVVSNKQKE